MCSILTGPTKTGNTKLCDALKKALLLKLPTLPSLPSGAALQGTPQSSGLVNLRGADPTLGGLLGGSR